MIKTRMRHLLPAIALLAYIAIPAMLPAESLSSEAAHVSRSSQLVLVIAPDWESSSASLQSFNRIDGRWQSATGVRPVVIGRAGSAWGLGLHPAQPGLQKQEGDGRAPAGIFTIGAAFGYAAGFDTKLDYKPMTADDYCIDVSDSIFYNQIINARERGASSVAGSTEPMRRDLHASGDLRYKIGFVVEHNRAQKPGHGSCIFAHLWSSEDSTTAGCTAMDEGELDALLAWLDPSLHPLFVLLPRQEYERLRETWQLPVFNAQVSSDQ